MQVSFRSGREFDDIKSVLQNLDFESNFNARIVDITDIPAGDFDFRHGLGAAPSGRIIISQIGGGIVTDQQRLADDKSFYMNNSSGTISLLRIIALR